MSSPVDGQPRHLELRVPAQVTARRLDACLVELEPELSRAAAQRLIGAGLCLLNGRPTKPAASVRPGDTITLTIPPPAPTEMVADALPLDIAYEDADVVVVNKARGMVVHPAAGNPRGTLANALLAHCTDLAGVGGELRPGIVHRLDKDTSGLLVAAKNDAAHRSLSSQIKARTARRSYWALCWGIPEPPTGEVEAPLGRHPVDRKRFTVREDGRPARTSYRVLERFQVGSKQTAALLECTLHTGVRTRSGSTSATSGTRCWGTPSTAGIGVSRGRRRPGWWLRSRPSRARPCTRGGSRSATRGRERSWPSRLSRQRTSGSCWRR